MPHKHIAELSREKQDTKSEDEELPRTEEPIEADSQENELPFELRIRRAHEDRSRDRRKTTKHRERLDGGVHSELEATQGLIEGRIIRSEGGYYFAELKDGTELRVKTTKRTRSAEPNATLVTIGDRVLIDTESGEAAIIAQVLDRQTKLLRRASGRSDVFGQVIVANIDVLVIVASILEPRLRSGIIDRYIVAGLDGGLEIMVVINKLDLATSAEDQAELAYFLKLYNGLGYPTFAVSSKLPESLEPLHLALTGKTSVFAGHSGVGKSSLVNVLLGTDDERIGELSKKFRRGAHTTSRSILLKLGDISGTYVVDTPGVREFENHAIEPENLKFFFVEFAAYQSLCPLANCSHVHEPGCAVIAAVDAKKLSIERYASYLKLFEEATTQDKLLREKF